MKTTALSKRGSSVTNSDLFVNFTPEIPKVFLIYIGIKNKIENGE